VTSNKVTLRGELPGDEDAIVPREAFELLLEILGQMGDMMEQELATMGPGMDAPAVVDETTGDIIAALRQVSAPAREARAAAEGSGDAGGPAS
jgi:hypothetical protein